MECFKLLLEHLARIEHQFLSGIRDLRKAGSLWGMMKGVVGVMKSELIGQSVRFRVTCWGFKGVQEEIPREEASTLQIGSVAYPVGQCTSPQLHPCHRLFEQDGHQDSSSPFQTFLLLTLGYSLSSRKKLEAVIMRQLRRWKRLWRRSLTRSHKRTSMGPRWSC